MRLGYAISLLGIVLIFLGTASFFLERVPRSGGTLTQGVLGYPQSINPLYADANTADKELSALLYDGLLAFDPTAQGYIPNLATGWTLSEDEKTYTVTLRNDVVWHDGDAFDAEDVLFTFHAVQSEEYGSPLFSAYQQVTLEAPDAFTVVFTLQDPYAPFPELLTLGILPSHLWSEIPPTTARFAALNIKPIGTGPYIAEKITKDNKGIIKSISYVRSKTYHGQQPYLKEILWKFFGDKTELLEAIQNKRIDATVDLLPTALDSLHDDAAIVRTNIPLFQYVGAFFNTKKETLANTDLRKALASALDRTAITAHATSGTGIPMDFTLPGFSSLAPATEVLNAGDALDALGYTRNEAGARVKGSTPLALTLFTPSRDELVRTASAIADAWRALGIEVTITEVPDGELSTVLKEKNYDVFLAAEQYGAYADPYPFWHGSAMSPGGLNVSQFANTATNTAVETLRTSASADARTSAFLALAQEMRAQMPAVFLFEQTLPLLHTAQLRGIDAYPLPHITARWNTVASWYKHTGWRLAF